MGHQEDTLKLIKQKAAGLGFDDCGVAACRPLEELRGTLESWLDNGLNGGLGYMARNVDKRLNPALLFEGARSVIICAVSYNRAPLPAGVIASRIASYALSRDYHCVIKEKLETLREYIGVLYPGSSGRSFVDTAPLLEKAWAQEAGMGWIGRNSLFVHPRLGSFVLLGAILTDAEIPPGVPYAKDGCTGCEKCLAVCPPGAILGNRTINAGKCISRLTVEKQNPGHAAPGNLIPRHATAGREIARHEIAGIAGIANPARATQPELHGWLFGCDVCQRACPHNVNAPVMDHDFFRPVNGIAEMTREDWLSLTEKEFSERFGETPLGRGGLAPLQERIKN